MSASTLNTFYADVLQALSIKADDDGHLTLHSPHNASAIPVEIEGNRLTLPLPQHLKSGDWDGKIAFHPMSEHPLRGQSEVIRVLLRTVRFRINSILSELMVELMTIASDPDLQKELNTRQSKYLMAVPDATKKTLKAIESLFQKEFPNIVSIYLHKSKDENARREAVVSFPMYKELCTEGTKAFDVDLGSIKNKKTIKGLFEFLIPGIDQDGKYNAISNSDKAPYFESLLLAFTGLAPILNKHIKTFKSVLQSPNEMLIDLTFEDDMENINTSRWKTAILPLPGNEGAAIKGEKAKTNTAVNEAASNLTRGLKQPTERIEQTPTVTSTPGTVPMPSPAPQFPQQPQWNQPQFQQPVQQSTGLSQTGKVSFRELQQQRAMSQGYRNQQPMMTQQFPQQPQQNPYGYTTPQQPGYPMQQQFNQTPSLAGTGVSTAWNNQQLSV